MLENAGHIGKGAYVSWFRPVIRYELIVIFVSVRALW